MRAILIIAGVALAAAAAGVEWSGRAGAANVGVAAKDPDVFEDGDGDAITTIAAGDTVTWTISTTGVLGHNVVADGGAFNSGAPQLSGTYAFPFNAAGTFVYYCAVHGAPGGFGMSGTIIVQAAPTATATNTTAAASATATLRPTRTTTGTPQATATPTTTPAATVTAAAATATPVSATQPSGGAAPIVRAPSTGDGSASQVGSSSHALSIALAVLGGAMIVGAIAVRRRV